MDSLLAIYHINATSHDIAARAAALALEQSVEMPEAAIRSQYVREHTLAKVASITPLSDRQHRVVIEFRAATTGLECGQLMNILFGNCSLQEDVQLVDVEFPQSLLDAFAGPKFGIEGLRERTGVYDRALTCTALKPQGLSAVELGELCGTFARAGIDVIKDDHGIADQTYAPFAERVYECQRAIDAAARDAGKLACYAPSLSGGPKALREQIRIAASEGVEMLLASPMIMGLPVFQELIADEIRVPVLAHPALSGALRIAPPLFYGKLFRLFGADAVIFPNFGGRFSFSQNTCNALVSAARDTSFGGCRTTMPVPAGGMNVERVPEMLTNYGIDTMLLIGGALLSAGDQLLDRSIEFVNQVAATSQQLIAS